MGSVLGRGGELVKVLLYTSPFPFQKANGGKTVFLKTRESLVRAGVRADLFDPWSSDLKRYDLVHCFTMESTDMWDFVRAIDVKLAVTPISWFGVYATRRSRVLRWLKRKSRSKIRCPLHSYWWEDCFTYPDVFFPNSKAQANHLQVAFGVPPENNMVVYHGVDERFADAKATLFEERYKLRDFVLWVGRYEVRKNPLSLVRALKGTGIPLVLIGRPDTARFNWYYEECVREADTRAVFIDDLDHESPVLAAAYAAARVFVLPSFLEAPGLAALEAGLAGCPVAVTEEGATREYLAGHARYLDPNSLDSIREAVLDCYQNSPRPNTALQEHIRRNFLWDKVIQRNVEGYHRILNASR
jgi:glycosyltransferase involved in cell wall biosynthesis